VSVDTWDWGPFLARDNEPPEDVHRRWYASGLVDGLPIVPPTPARIRAMYRGAAMDPVRAVTVVEPALRLATVYDLAVCAVAAGCQPEYLPIVAAALRAMAEPPFNLLGIQSTTGTATPVVLVHGPIAVRAGVSGGGDCLGSSAHANATIGRAVRVALRTLGGAIPAAMDAATMGQPAKIGLCFAENLAASPWPPLHTTRGFRADDDAVTVAGITGTVEVVHGESEDPEEILVTLAGSMLSPGNIGARGLVGGGSPLVVLSPEHARALAGAGLDRAAVQDRLWQRACLPLSALPAARAESIRRARRDSDQDAERPLRVAETAEDILIAVAGGVGIKSSFLPSWGGGTRAITVGV
jgi:hypothetical protein